MKSINKNIAISVVVSLIVGGALGYLGGMRHGSGQSVARAGMMGGQMQGARGGFARGGAGANMVNGDVVSFSSSTLTVKARDGSSRVVLFTGTTKVTKSVDGARTDVKDGSQVVIIGTQNSDGTITAESVQLRSSSTMMMPPR